MSETNQKPLADTTQKPKKWPRVLLAVSLTLNLLVAGAVAGAFLRAGADTRSAGPPPARSAMRDLGYGAFIDALPRDQRRALGRALRDKAGSFTANREKLAGEFSAILSALRADPFQPDALGDVLDQQKMRISQRTLVGRDLVLDRINAMTTQERQTFADRLEHSVQHALEKVRK